jgi:hypothetical protein
MVLTLTGKLVAGAGLSGDQRDTPDALSVSHPTMIAKANRRTD